MKKYITGIICVLIVCCAGTAFGSDRNHGRGQGGHGHGSYHHDNRGYSHHGYSHAGWGYGFYAPAVPVVAPVYPVYYTPVVRCRYITVYDAWGNYRGQERVCD
jgi:hypothetical protein